MTVATERYLAHMPGIAIQRGAPWGFSVRRITGRNDAVADAPEDVWEAGGTMPLLNGETIEILSSDAADDASGGTGARIIEIVGLNSIGDEIAEIGLLDGTSPMTIGQSFYRINSARVYTAGTGNAAAGTITIRIVGGATVAQIGGLANVSLATHFTVPRDMTAYITGARYSSDVSGTSRFDLMVREGNGTWTTGVFRAVDTFQTGQTPIAPAFQTPIVVPELSDIKVVCSRGQAQDTQAIAGYDIVIAPKSLSAVRSIARPQV